MAPKPEEGSTRTPGSGNFQGVSPVLLSAGCDIVAGNSGVLDSGQLSYPFRKAIVIEEIRIDIRLPSVELQVNLGSMLYAKFQFGSKFLMRDPVPVWLLGTFASFDQEEQWANELATPAFYSHYRWRLPSPLYIEAGDVLRTQLTRGQDGFGTMTAQVTYAGRTVAPDQPRPDKILVPYAAPFVTTLGQVYQQSNENHLFNPFDVPLRIQRLTGRSLLFLAGPVGEASAKLTSTPATVGAGVTILMDDDWGGKMCNNNTGPSDIFDSARGAWTVDTLMPPKSMYLARVWNIQPADNFSRQQQIHMAMIGEREENI